MKRKPPHLLMIETLPLSNFLKRKEEEEGGG